MCLPTYVYLKILCESWSSRQPAADVQGGVRFVKVMRAEKGAVSWGISLWFPLGRNGGGALLCSSPIDTTPKALGVESRKRRQLT